MFGGFIVCASLTNEEKDMKDVITTVKDYYILEASGGGDLRVQGVIQQKGSLYNEPTWICPDTAYSLLGEDVYCSNPKIAEAIKKDYDDAMSQCIGVL